MSSYKTIIDKDNIILKKKDNKIKLESTANIKLPCKIIEMVETLEFYDLLKIVNEKLINKIKILKNENNINDIIIFLNDLSSNIDDDDDDENEKYNYYITFTNKIIKNNEDSISINGSKNNVTVNLENYKKLNIDNISIKFDIQDSKLLIILKFEFEDKIPIYLENTIGLIFRKMFCNINKYFSP